MSNAQADMYGAVRVAIAADPELEGLDPSLYLAILERFAGRGTVDFDDAAAILGIDRKTLRNHVRCGNITFLCLGSGVRKVRRVFTARDIAAFYCRRRTSHTAFLAPVSRRRLVRPVAGFLASRKANAEAKAAAAAGMGPQR